MFYTDNYLPLFTGALFLDLRSLCHCSPFTWDHFPLALNGALGSILCGLLFVFLNWSIVALQCCVMCVG